MGSPIGIFDSGVGGMSILHVLEEALPSEKFIYFADCAHFPYGQKSGAELIGYAKEITSFLVSQKIQLLVVACHSASVYVLEALQSHFSIPIIGMIDSTVAAVKEATKNGHIAILATPVTIASGVYQKAILEEIPGSRLSPVPCFGLAEQVEKGESDTVQTQKMIQGYLEKIQDPQVDTLLLACTHYPYLEKLIHNSLDSILIVNPAKRLAQRVKEQLKIRQNLSLTPKHTFYISGKSIHFQAFLEKHPPKKNFEMHFFQ